MRYSRSLSVAAVAIVLLTACGSSGDDAAPTPDTSAPASTAAPATDSTVLAVGEATGGTADGAALYGRCAACHQTTGAGLPGAFPPLAGSEWATGNAAVPIRVVLHGLQGPITVEGVEYNSIMLPYGGTGEMTDAEVAAVLTYVRSSFGNNASAVTAEQVAAVRAETAGRTSSFTAAELQPLLN